MLPLVLAPVLAVGSLVLSPATAHAVVPSVTTPLPVGQALSPAAMAVFGSTIVWDNLRSSDNGATWHADAALADRQSWDFIGGGKMARRPFSVNATTTAFVYTPATGALQSYVIASGSDSLNATYASYYLGVRDLATNTPTFLTQPTGVTASSWSHELSSSNALLWRGSLNGSESLFAASSTPFTTPSPWVQILNVKASQVTDTDFLYLIATPSAVSLCKRSLAAFTAAPACTVVVSGDFTTGYTLTVASMGAFSLVRIADYMNGTPLNAYVVSGSMTSVLPVQLPTGSAVVGAVPGGSPDVVVFDANSVPTVDVLAANGALTPAFTIPATKISRPYALGVAPDRVDGGDTRDGSTSLPVWSRSVSSSGFDTETALPARASGISVSAGRTAVLGRAGVLVFDRGTLQHTFADQTSTYFKSTYFAEVSGPYVIEGQLDASNNASTKVSKADGTLVQTFAGMPVGVFGSQYLTGTVDALPTGSLHLVVHDLTGVAADASYALPAGTAECYPTDVWGATIAVACDTGTWAGTSRVYNYKTGALLGSTTGTTEGLGDGYALVSNGPTYSLWAIAANTVSPSVCNATEVPGNYMISDGVGHIVCASDTDLIWQDYSALATQAPRLLGTLAAATASFSEPGSTWSLAMDTTKALSAGSVVISNSLGTQVRSLATPASADGSVRVTWDGLDGSGKPVPTGPYTYKLVANAADGTGAVVSITGAGTASGSVIVTAASTVGMVAGGLATLSPSRLLDTRITGPKLGAGQTRVLQVTGVGGLPTTGVSAVVLNVTVTETTNGGYLTVSPTGTTRPVASNLNWSSGGVTIPNAVTVKVGAGGKIDLYQSGPGTAQVVVDIAGYYLDGAVTEPGGFAAISPARIPDTRSNGGAVEAKQTRDLLITGAGGVPASNVSAVVLNVTVTETTTGGYLTAFPYGSPQPTASNLNWSSAGFTIPNLVVVKVGDGGKVSLFQSGPGSAQVIVDVAGYFAGGTATKPGMFVALSPARLLDTRTTSKIAGGGEISLPVLGKAGITGAAAVVANVTVTETASGGFLTVYPGGSALPTASNLNWSVPGTTIPNLVTVQLGPDGTIVFHNASPGSTQIIADFAGYYLSS